ncbi:MAG: DUF87 domain-containing protein [Pseudomonadota bacterium]
MSATQEREDSARAIGRIVSVAGSRVLVMLNHGGDVDARPQMGSLLRIDSGNTKVLGLISALSIPAPSTENEPEIWIAELELVGEFARTPDGGYGRFRRGVAAYPALGDVVYEAAKDELDHAYANEGENAIRVGLIKQNASIPATVKVNDLLGKHFAVLGTTGSGKSCAVALILRAILQRHQNAHVVLLDPHNEYANSFGAVAELVNPSNLHLPYWLFTFEEFVEVLFAGQENSDAETEILSEMIPAAKRVYGAGAVRAAALITRKPSETGQYTVDTPTPYRMSDILSMIEEELGKLDKRRELAPYKRLKARIEGITHDSRYSFMFGGLTIQDTMADVLARIFRVPVAGKPLTIIDLAGLPSEVVNVVVSVLSRMAFDFALWGAGQVPITLVCEEAHRYAPVNDTLGFEPTKRALSRIAKEGRKYGVSLCVVSQRPAELDPTLLSQCNTLFAMRMANQFDQELLSAAISESATSLLEALPSLGLGEAIAFGEGVPLPTRMRFDALPKDAIPRSATANFARRWSADTTDATFIEEVVARWRAQGRTASGPPPVAATTPPSRTGEM